MRRCPRFGRCLSRRLPRWRLTSRERKRCPGERCRTCRGVRPACFGRSPVRRASVAGSHQAKSSPKKRSPIAPAALLAGDPTAPELARRIAAALAPPPVDSAGDKAATPVKLRTVLLIVVVLVIVGIVVYESGLLDRLRTPTTQQAQPPTPSPAADAPYQIYFTQPLYPDRPDGRRGGIDERFVDYVNSATRTLDMAIYDFDLENVAQAMANARARGVAVRMVTDSDTLNNTRDAAIQKALGIVRGPASPSSATSAGRSCITSSPCVTARRSGPAPGTGPPATPTA